MMFDDNNRVEPEEKPEAISNDEFEFLSSDKGDIQETTVEIGATGFAAAHPVLKEVIDWISVIGIALLITFVIRTFVFTMVVVEGPSMENTLQTGDRLAVVRLGYEPAKGDIIVFYPNGNKERPYIKRVIATEGQTVDIRDAKVYVDGELITEPYLGSPTTESGNQAYPVTIPQGHLFAMGDNRQHSLDCRSTSVGLVDYKDVVGKAWIRLFPFDNRFGGLY